MTISYKFSDSGKIEQVNNNLELVEIVKNSNAHTSGLTTQQYVERQLSVMKNLWGAEVPEQATADTLVAVWITHNIVSKVG